MPLRFCRRLARRLLTTSTMENRARPLVARIPSIVLPPQLQEIFDKAAKDFEIVVTNPSEISNEIAQKVEGLVLYMSDRYNIDANLMNLFPNLKVISSNGVGVNHIDLAAATKRGIAVGNTPGVLTDCTADMAFALLLASARNVVEGDRIARSPDTKEVINLCVLLTEACFIFLLQSVQNLFNSFLELCTVAPFPPPPPPGCCSTDAPQKRRGAESSLTLFKGPIT